MAQARPLAASALGTPADTYLYALAASRDGQDLATIGSDDALRLFDPSLRLVHTLPSCHAGVSCLQPHPAGGGVVTAGRDGLIKVWDARGTTTTPAAQLAEPQGRGLSALAGHAATPYLAAGTESTQEGLGDVGVLLYDLRRPGAPLRAYAESHTDSVTQLAFHPARPRLLLSGSTDGLVSLFDVEQADEDDALRQVLNPRAAVHRCGFLAPDRAYVVTTDEHFSLYPLTDPADAEDPASPPPPTIHFGDVRAPLRCLYVVDLLLPPPGAGAGADPVLACGHHDDHTLSLVQLHAADGGWAFGSRVELAGAHGAEVVRDVALAPDRRRAFSCGEDGHVRVWDLAGAVGEGRDAEVDGGKAAKKARREKKGERFAPY